VHFYSNFWSLGQSNKVSQNVQGDVTRAGAPERRRAPRRLTRAYARRPGFLGVPPPRTGLRPHGRAPRGSMPPEQPRSRATPPPCLPALPTSPCATARGWTPIRLSRSSTAGRRLKEARVDSSHVQTTPSCRATPLPCHWSTAVELHPLLPPVAGQSP
jgi:hypothetical protein